MARSLWKWLRGSNERAAWNAQYLWPKAELVSFLLMQNENVCGVALTGSLARFEHAVHDLDFVILHNGKLKDGSAKEPPRREPYYNNDLILNSAIDSGSITRHIKQALGVVPADFIFVNVQALWNCEYLQSLERQEVFTEF